MPTYTQFMGYLPVIQPSFVEFDKLTVCEGSAHGSVSICLESESPPVIIHYTYACPQPLGFFTVVEPLLVEVDDFLICK